jgi:hypothetical protein
MEVGEIQRDLNQKVGSKLSGAVDFTSRFVIIIESMNFKFIKSTNLDAKSTAPKDFKLIF